MANQTNSVKNAKSAKMAVVMGTGKEVSKPSVEPQLILLPSVEEVKAEPKEAPKTEPKKATVKVEPKEAPKAEPKKATVKVEPKEAPKAEPKKARKMSIDELTDKAERVYLLQGKYAEIRDKRKQLQSFTIKHEEDTAQLTLVDAKGQSIVTHNPKAIGQLLNNWMKDLNDRLSEVESELRAELEALS